MISIKEIRTEQAGIRRQVLKLIDQCAYCGEDTKEILQVHHIIPVAEGGTNDINNLIVLCPNCHTKAHRNIISIEELKSVADVNIFKKAVCKIRKKRETTNIFESIFRSKLAENGLSMAKFAEDIGTSPQNLTQRVKRGAISYDEAVEFAEMLGYKIEWIKQ